MGNFDDLPGRGRNHEIEEKAEAAFVALLAESDHFIMQQSDRKDYGTDCQIEVLDQGSPTNVRIHAQLKGSERALNADGSLSISVKRTNLNYLLTQRYSLFVAYHVPTRTLRIASVEDVLRQYEHEGSNWTEQSTLTIRFHEEFTFDRLKKLAGLARFSATISRDRRLAQITATSSELPALLSGANPSIHVPEDQEHAANILEQLYDSGADAMISGAFEQFVAVLGLESDAIGFCYMAETNLGMAGHSRFPERIKASIAYFERKIVGGRYQEGSLYYTIGNAHSALGDESSAKASYQVAAADMAFMADTGIAAQCLKNLGSSFERLGDEDTAADLYRGALEMNSQLPEAHFALGLFYHRKGLFPKAIEHFDAVVFTESDLGKSEVVSGWRLNALLNVGDIRAAFRTINQLLAIANREPWIWPWCARQVAAFGKTSIEAAHGALSFWQRYVHANPAVSQARVNLLLTQFYLRQEGEDIGKDYLAFQIEFDVQIAQIEPEESALIWDRLGHWAQDEGNWYEAERCFRKAYEIDGGHYGYCLGVALNFLGRYEEALSLVLAQAKGIQPDELSWFQVGLAKEKLGKTAEAVEAYREALILSPDYSLAMFNMAGTLWNSGDHERAAIVFRTAAQQFPEHELTTKLLHDLPELFEF